MLMLLSIGSRYLGTKAKKAPIGAGRRARPVLMRPGVFYGP